MAILRLHNGINTILDWQNSNKYGTNVISQIQDPNGATAKIEITSIPTPFARIDLVKTAFKMITDARNLVGETIYHKMISDSFDVGEIFFNADKLKNKIEILVWDKSIDLPDMINSQNQAHKSLGETLEMYLQQDASAYNFNQMNRIYMLNYIGPGKPAQMNIIGATSPVTLFFSSANDLSYVSNHIQFGQDKVFDGTYQPLYKRDFEFIKYLFSFRISEPNFSTYFPEVDVYLNQTYTELTNHQKNELNALNTTSINNYDSLIIDGANHVEVLGRPFHKKPANIKIISDFEIKTSLYKGKLPLILPIEAGNTYANLKYTQDNWQKTDKAPYFDKTPWQKRTLPIIGDQHPYITISDLLEDTIIRMPYELNTSAFFNGNYDKNAEHCFLLPIRDLFFSFFTVEDLQKTLPNGKRMFELTKNSGGVKATLRLPISGGFIEYERLYFDKNSPDLLKNEGGLIEEKFGLGLYSNVRFNSDEKPHYRIALFDKSHSNMNLCLYNDNTPVLSKGQVLRHKKGEITGVETYIFDKNFNRISVSVGQVKGVIVPIFIQKGRTSQYSFAVDFGTTNTHIEYRVDDSPSKPFDITRGEKQMQRLHLDYRSDKDIQYAFENNFLPDTIFDEDEYGFPLRTAFSEYNEFDPGKSVFSLGSGNIPFRYEKAPIPPYNKVKTNLKWSTKEQVRIRLYIENVFLLMRNKVLLNGGKLDDTKVIWFYPASMTEAHFNKFKEIWQSLYQEYFGNNIGNVITMSESVAPYNYYKYKKGAKSNVVTIDIGGGSTDVYVVEDSTPKILSSFRFASNTIFGDGYNYDSDSNGFVSEFLDDILQALGTNGLSELESALKSIEKNKKSIDIVAFLFSLSCNKQTKEKNINSLNFKQMLSDHNKLKYLFIIFYSAILYYVANLMKAKGIALPYTIAFSGNGSKSLSVLSSDNNTLKNYIKLIFETVYGAKYSDNDELEIIYEENPKEATCKGGILNPTSQTFADIANLKLSLLGNDLQTFVSSKKYSEIDNSIQKDVSNEVIKFIDFVFDLHKNNNSFFVQKFDVDGSILDSVSEICKKNVLEYMKLGMENKKEKIKDLGTDGELEETLFFYPLVGILNNLAREINKMK